MFLLPFHSITFEMVMWLCAHVCPFVRVSSSLILSRKMSSLLKPNCSLYVCMRVSECLRVCVCVYAIACSCSFGLLTFSAKSNNDRALEKHKRKRIQLNFQSRYHCLLFCMFYTHSYLCIPIH